MHSILSKLKHYYRLTPTRDMIGFNFQTYSASTFDVIEEPWDVILDPQDILPARLQNEDLLIPCHMEPQ